METARSITLDMLIRMDTQGSYSNIVLDNMFNVAGLTARDKAFSTALFYGVLERRMTLDYIIRYYSSIEFDKISIPVVNILRIGLYQLLYMNSVPESASVNESVLLCDKIGIGKAKGFINAILRSFIRADKIIDFGSLENEAKLSIEYSCPKWLIKKWINELGEERALTMLRTSFGRPPIYARVNSNRFSVDEVINTLAKDKIKAKKNNLIDNCIEITNSRGIETCIAYRKGMFHIQDISSQICCKIINPVFNETVVDMCAAPGGKTFTCAEIMGGRGSVFSYDLYNGKVDTIKSGAKRLGLSIITADEGDATMPNPNIPLADKVICDVPCSGLGVIRRKPEIKYKPMKSLDDLPAIQSKIIENASAYVKDGGTLIYSTCTVSKKENDDVVATFLENHPEFVPIVVPVNIKGVTNSYKRTFIPSDTGGDGFFVATLRKIK